MTKGQTICTTTTSCARTIATFQSKTASHLLQAKATPIFKFLFTFLCIWCWDKTTQRSPPSPPTPSAPPFTFDVQTLCLASALQFPALQKPSGTLFLLLTYGAEVCSQKPEQTLAAQGRTRVPRHEAPSRQLLSPRRGASSRRPQPPAGELLLLGGCSCSSRSRPAAVSRSGRAQRCWSTPGFLRRDGRSVTPGAFLPDGLSSARFLSPWEGTTVQIVTGFFPKPNLASYAALLAVKCAEVTFPSGVCCLPKPADPVAHKTWVLSSKEAPAGLSWVRVALRFAPM